jgi:hypothetical protein
MPPPPLWVIPGWPYSVIAALEPDRTSWTAVLDAVHPGPMTMRPRSPPRRSATSSSLYGRHSCAGPALERTFRLFKRIPGWTTPKIRSPDGADQWTWLIITCHAQLRRPHLATP